MPIKGEKLFVNLGASQARRRLKGFGHGVRKVETAGRTRAVVIHTAYGHSLRELEAKFADVGCAATEASLREQGDGIWEIRPSLTSESGPLEANLV